MNQKYKVWGFGLVVIVIVAFVTFLLTGSDIAVLQPAGEVAYKQRALMVTAVLLGMLVIVPVFILTFWIVWRYREGNTKVQKRYTPDQDHNLVLETLWWVVPCIIIAVLSVITWRSSHELDPFKPLASSSATPVTVQVVALPWKWLFIYPEQGIATVNYIHFPVGTPVNFEITADAPMNSFWIPQLGGQMYAMSGMSTQLHVIADKPGDYRGSSANLSGEGFAGMNFTAHAGSPAEFRQWVKGMKTYDKLDMKTYTALAKPSKNNPHTSYSAVDSNLYDKVMMKYMAPPPETPEMEMEGMDHMDHSAMNHKQSGVE